MNEWVNGVVTCSLYILFCEHLVSAATLKANSTSRSNINRSANIGFTEFCKRNSFNFTQATNFEINVDVNNEQRLWMDIQFDSLSLVYKSVKCSWDMEP